MQFRNFVCVYFVGVKNPTTLKNITIIKYTYTHILLKRGT